MPDLPGNRFGEVAVREGFATRTQVRDCLEIQAKLRDYGVAPKRLGEIMVEKGFLSQRDVEAILEVQRLGQSQSRVETRSGVGSRIAPVDRTSDSDQGPLDGDSAPLREIPGYEILDTLGQGGMGTVYKAKQKSLDRVVALKVLPSRAARDEQFIKKFISEARTVAKLNHENIIAGIDVGEANGTYYFAMEFVDGESLAKLVEREGPLDEERALRVTLQIARALEHAHKHGLVHRDVKPQNVLVSSRRLPEDDSVVDLAKLCDLGLAKSLDERRSSGEREGLPLGTPHYLSPEQARGEADVDIRSDIYSLGATLYHALTGRPPFEGQSPMVLMTKHLTEDPVPPKKRNSEVSKGTSDLVLRMMSKAKEDRHQTPQELIEDLERQLEGKPQKPRGRASTAGAKSATVAPKKRRAREEDTPPPSSRRSGATRTRAGRPDGAQTGQGGAMAAIAIIIFVACIGLYFVASQGEQPPSAQEEHVASEALLRAKTNIPYVTPPQGTDEERRQVREQLERISRSYPRTQAGQEARKLAETLRGSGGGG